MTSVPTLDPNEIDSARAAVADAAARYRSTKTPANAEAYRLAVKRLYALERGR